MNISDALIYWYIKHKRELPWRESNDPYHIWLSEIILQQTRVEQGKEYYLRFINTYSTIGFLSAASEDDVLKMWQGLGYYSRARNLHYTAKYITRELGGKFPDTYTGLLDLKGVGPYTAAAIASIAYGLPHAVVDGNVMRVLARLFDVSEPVNSTEGAKIIKNLADEILNPARAGDHNQAVMELGAVICTPRSPKCSECPVAAKCLAKARNTIEERPVKLKKQKAKLRYIHYAVLDYGGGLIFRQRTGEDIWKGLHDFESEEGSAEISPVQWAKQLENTFPGMRITALPSAPEYEAVHLLTHRRIEAKFWRFGVSGITPNKSPYKSVSKKDIERIAVPRLVHKYLEKSKWL